MEKRKTSTDSQAMNPTPPFQNKRSTHQVGAHSSGKRSALELSVGRNKVIKTTNFLLAFFCFLTASYAQNVDKKSAWDSRATRILEADVIVVQQIWFTKISAWNIQKRIKYGKRYNKRFERILTTEETKDLHELLVYEPSRDSNTACGCRGVFQIEFKKKDEIVFGIGYAHGRFTAPISNEAETKILELLDSHDFPTDEWIKKEKEMEDSNQSVATTPVSAPL